MLFPMDVVTVIERSGGLSTRAALLAATTRLDVDRAVRDGAIIRAGHGRYTLPSVGEAARIAHGANGVLSLTSAALQHGWEVKVAPDKPHVTFPRHRNIPAKWREQVTIHRGDLMVDDITDVATSRELTLTQCLRLLPADEALVIADSALRHGEVATLRRAVASVRGRGQTKAQRIGKAARGEAANAFESATRAICNTVPGLHVEPQVVISTPTCWARPDLVDRDRKLVVECESFEWHAVREGFRKDVRRYTLLVAEGWTVLRFVWEDVMFRPEWVRDVLIRTLGGDARTVAHTAWPFAA
jgi:very-short-patch-repair endonuclease